MRVFYCDHHEVVLPPEHRFPMAKYATLRAELVARGVLAPEELAAAEAVPLAALTRIHDPEYVAAFLSGALPPKAMAQIGFPWSPELVRRSLASVGATLAAVDAAFADGFSGSLAGGTHHAHRERGAGFCVFNDLAVAAGELLATQRARRVLIVDLDVHQGDGTAEIFRDDARVFTFSMHGAKNFPGRKARSDLDVELDDDTDDETYLRLLERHLARACGERDVDFVLYQGGVDPLQQDRLGRLGLSHDGLERRDRMVFEATRALGVPLVATLGGGYAEPIDLSIDAHVNTYRAARDVFGARARRG
ncbi:MAG: histone deacetylase [Planctomycetes bacterium]|nr:histone deacetylase [Planctomycetota bacterium]